MPRKTGGASIELRKLTIYERMSEETTAFVAEIYIDGVQAGHAKNDGHGGSTYYHAYPEHHKLIKYAEEACLALPPIQYPAGHGMKAFEIPMNLEHFIDNLVTAELHKKADKKLEKKMANHIMWGVKGGHSYSQVKFGKPFAPAHREQLQTYIDTQVKPILKEGEVIFNTNLQALGITI